MWKNDLNIAFNSYPTRLCVDFFINFFLKLTFGFTNLFLIDILMSEDKKN